MAKANGHFQQFEACNPPVDDCSDVPTSNATATGVSVVSAGLVLADNRILDLIRQPGSESEVMWLVWDKGEFSLARQVESGGCIYVPPAMEGDVVRAVQMPVGLGACLKPRELLGRMQAVIHKFVDIGDDDGFLMAAFALATFFADRLTLAPYLFLSGPPGSGKTTALQLLCRMTRRGLLAGDMSRAALYNLVHLIAPTLLLDESDLTSDHMSRDIMRLLRNGNRLGADIHVNGRRFNVFGPKVICGRTPVEDIALSSRGFRITMLPSRNIYPFLDAEQQQQIANEFQPLLERFRLEHYHEVKMAVADDKLQLTPRMNDLFRVLAAPMLGDAELAARVGDCLKVQNEDSQFERFGDPEWMVAAALYYRSHEGDSRLFIGNLYMTVNDLLAEACETYRLSSEKISRIARHQLGVRTQRVGRGTYILMTADVKRKIHVLARNMGLTRANIMDPAPVLAGYAGPPCDLCQEFGLYKLPDGRELRPIALPLSKLRRKRLFDEEETTGDVIG